MLLALLYRADCNLAAAALACEQQPYGDRYWREIHADAIPLFATGETSYVDVKDEALAERLLAMSFRDGTEAAAAVDDYLFAPADVDVPMIVFSE